MKTIDYLRHYLPVVTISTILIASTIAVNAEDHSNRGKSGKGHERKEYREPARNFEKKSHYDSRNQKYGNRDDRDREYRAYRNDYHPQYTKKKSHSKPNCYTHPKYGRVYNRFDRNPMVFRHQHGDYYYSGNNFYRYHDGIGYCRAEPPRNVYFRHLPVECNRVFVNGQVFFRSGDLFFELSPRGYFLVPAPNEIRLSLRF